MKNVLTTHLSSNTIHCSFTIITENWVASISSTTPIYPQSRILVLIILFQLFDCNSKYISAFHKHVFLQLFTELNNVKKCFHKKSHNVLGVIMQNNLLPFYTLSIDNSINNFHISLLKSDVYILFLFFRNPPRRSAANINYAVIIYFFLFFLQSSNY